TERRNHGWTPSAEKPVGGVKVSFNIDQRVRHQNLAEQAYRSGKFDEAVFHTAKTAEYTLALAEQCKGQVARALLDQAKELLEVPEEMRARPRAAVAAQPQSRETDDADVSEWQLAVRPETRLKDVAGLEDVKKALRDNVIWPRQHPEHYERYKVKPQ